MMLNIRPMRTQIAVLLVFLLASISLGFQRSADTLPTRLGDDDFWQMITSFSEPDGHFISDNYVSNELSYQTVIPDLRQHTLPGGVYLGVGPEQNFSYIAAIQPKIAFIIDIRRQNLLQLLMYKALFEISDNRADFVAHLFSRPMTRDVSSDSTAEALFTQLSRTPSDQLQRDTMAAIDNNLRRKHGFKLSADDVRKIESVFKVFGQVGPAMDYNTGGRTSIPNIPTYSELMVATDNKQQNWSYVQTEERFQYLKDLQEKNLIVPIVGDFSGPRAIQSVALYIRDHNASVTVFYVSNVEDYLEKGWSKYIRNIGRLPTDRSSLFIRYIAKKSVLDPMSLVPTRWPGRRGGATAPARKP
jgi:hypothetical protein